MKSFTQFLTESASPSAHAVTLSKHFGIMQYFFQVMLKKKNLKRAATHAVSMLSGTNNWALGGAVPAFDSVTIIEAYYMHQAEYAAKQLTHVLPGKQDWMLEGIAKDLFLDLATLKRYM